MGSARSLKSCLKAAGWNPASVRQAGQAKDSCEALENYILMGPHGTRNKAKHDVTLLHRNLPTNTENTLGVIGKEAFPTRVMALAFLLIADTCLLQLLCKRFSTQEIYKAKEGEQDGEQSRWRLLPWRFIPRQSHSQRKAHLVAKKPLLSSPVDSASKLKIASKNGAASDLNDQMGNTGAEPKKDVDEKMVRASRYGPEMYAALKAVWLHRCLLSTFENNGPAYCGIRQGTKSRIDIIAASRDFKNCMKQCRVLEIRGQRPQLTQCTPPRPRDGSPLVELMEETRQQRRLQSARRYRRQLAGLGEAGKRNYRTTTPKPDKQMWWTYLRQEGAKDRYEAQSVDINDVQKIEQQLETYSEATEAGKGRAKKDFERMRLRSWKPRIDPIEARSRIRGRATPSTVRLKCGHPLAEKLKEAGVMYNEAVQTNPGHMMGPPHFHYILCLLRWLAEEETEKEKTEENKDEFPMSLREALAQLAGAANMMDN